MIDTCFVIDLLRFLIRENSSDSIHNCTANQKKTIDLNAWIMKRFARCSCSQEVPIQAEKKSFNRSIPVAES